MYICFSRQIRKWEAARRQRFNAVLEELRLELPDCGPRAKVEVVLSAIKFIQECKALKESFMAGNAPLELSKYRLYNVLDLHSVTNIPFT